MRQSILFVLASALFLAGAPVTAQEAADHLGIPGPVALGGTEYALAWSSRPGPDYIKQEYLPPGQTPETYQNMVLIEFVAGDLAPADAAARQVEMLNDRKQSDPIANFQILNNQETGEVILDFVLSAKDSRGEYIIEWNGYRYAPAVDGAGRPGVMLFALSHRAYGNDASRAFLEGLRGFKDSQLQLLAAAPLPRIGQ